MEAQYLTSEPKINHHQQPTNQLAKKQPHIDPFHLSSNVVNSVQISRTNQTLTTCALHSSPEKLKRNFELMHAFLVDWFVFHVSALSF